ncbi:hypothetical protein ACFYTQ_33530 [Nocardia sp. NPDC004068]|uniref:hypothetical protein n=1 Tax=Nocardia sp. NPDC004068 TaxID=3364303 RepID=UPI0036CD3AB2
MSFVERGDRQPGATPSDRPSVNVARWQLNEERAARRAAADAVLMTLAESILRNSAYQDDSWESLTLVAVLADTESQFGYVYDREGGWAARVPQGFEVLDKMIELRSVMSVPGKPDWKTCLLQIKRADMSLKVDFEYDDVDRWQVTPQNLREKVEELRPR